MRNRIMILFFLTTLLCGCGQDYKEVLEINDNITTTEESGYDSKIESDHDFVVQLEKGYDLPLDEDEAMDLQIRMDSLFAIIGTSLSAYYSNTKCETSMPDKEKSAIIDQLSEQGYIVKSDDIYSNLENWKAFESFLLRAQKGKSGEAVLYEVDEYGAITEKIYKSMEGELYVLSARFCFNTDGQYAKNYVAKTRIKTWRYTETGWFGYELCVPEYPEVSEVMNGSVLLRVKPVSEENRAALEKFVLGLYYKGSNILCTSWNEDTIEKLDFTALYEDFYLLEYKDYLDYDVAEEGIPKDEFEELLMKYLQVNVEQIRDGAVYDENNNVYLWKRFGCGNYHLDRFGESYPEVQAVRQNDDGTITLTVNAVCESLNNEAFIKHELTIKENSDGSFVYLKNEILDNGEQNVPEYQYRMW